MAKGIGIIITERVGVGVVEDNALVGSARFEPEDQEVSDSLHGLPAEQIFERIAGLVKQLGLTEPPAYVGIGLPGIVRNGSVEDSPNLVQFKGVNIQEMVSNALVPLFGKVPVWVYNDADAMAAGVAATHNFLDRLIRVWTLGTGIGYGRYPFHTGVWEAGHSVPSRLIPRNISADAAARDIWKASWGTGQSGCALWIWSRKRFSHKPKRARRDAWNL